MSNDIRELEVDELENVVGGGGGSSGGSNSSGTCDLPLPNDLKSIIWGAHH